VVTDHLFNFLLKSPYQVLGLLEVVVGYLEELPARLATLRELRQLRRLLSEAFAARTRNQDQVKNLPRTGMGTSRFDAIWMSVDLVSIQAHSF
jgi:hypothetical protein